MSNHCTECGNQIPKKAKFCGFCGAKIAVITVSSTGATIKNRPKGLKEIIQEIPRVRQEGEGHSGWSGNPSCELCRKSWSDRQCPYCGRWFCNEGDHLDSEFGCCIVCAQFIRRELKD